MKSLRVARIVGLGCTVLIAAAALNLVAYAQMDAVSVEYTFAPPVAEHGVDGDRITIPGLPSYGAPGAPVLPFRTARILLPYGTHPEVVEVVPAERKVLPGHYRLEPGQELLPTGAGPAHTRTPPDPAIYQAEGLYPDQPYSTEATQTLAGYTILYVRLFPVQVEPQTGTVYYCERLVLRVTTAPDAIAAAAQTPMLRTGAQDAARVVALVDNPAEVVTYRAASRVSSAPASALVDAADPYDYIVITNDSLRSAYGPLLQWKRSRGLLARSYSTQEIYANYAGPDRAAKIRSFLRDAYTTWATTGHPLQYVLLGGDDGVVPVRKLYAPGSGFEEHGGWLPSDMYYGGLDGTWDADGDGRYGEDAADGVEGEEADFMAEVYVGRWTVDTAAEVSNLANKTLTYERDAGAEYLHRALLMGNRMDDVTWGGNTKDVVAARMPQYEVTALYERDGTFAQQAVIDTMNAGTHLVNFCGHGNWVCCPLEPWQVDGLTNREPFLFFNEGCYTAAFDEPVSGSDEAVAEHYLFGASGGFAYIGNTRYGWYSPGSTDGPGNLLDRLFFEEVSHGEARNTGKALQFAKENCYNYYWAHRWSILTLALLGDPETPLVSEFLWPVADITAPDGGETLRDQVDILGIARAGDAPAATFGDYRVEVGAGVTPTVWSLLAAPSTSPVDGGPLVAGWDTNLLGDGVYTLRLVAGDGSGRTDQDRAVVTVDNAYFTFPQEGDSLRAGARIALTGTAKGPDFQRYIIEVCPAGDLACTPVSSSTTPVTDGLLLEWDSSGFAEGGEYTLRLTMIGSAHTSSDTVTVYLDPGLEPGWPQFVAGRMVAPTVAIGDLEADGDLEVVAVEDPFVHAWHHDGIGLPGWPQQGWGLGRSAPALADLDRDGDLEVIVAGLNGSLYAWHHDGSNAAGWPDALGSAIWGPAVADLDADGFVEVVAGADDRQVHAWRADGSAVAGWPQASGGTVVGSPAVADLDGDGRPEVVALANDRRVYAWRADGTGLPGWPQTTLAPLPESSPAIGDLDGDGDREVVVAGDQVYAWHHDGTAVAGWPRPEGWTSTRSSPVIGDLDGDGDLEVILSVDYRVFAWHGDGQAVENWPVEMYASTGSSPAVGDIDGDGDVEVVHASIADNGSLYAWHHDGRPVAAWPKRIPRDQGQGTRVERLSSPVLEDLDQDGALEVAIGLEREVLAWDLPGASAGRPPEWKMFKHDLWQTGAYGPATVNLPPAVWDVRAQPAFLAPAQELLLTARLFDEDGVALVVAEIESPDETVWSTVQLYDDGAHDDGAAADGLFGRRSGTPSAKRDFVVDLKATDGQARSSTHDNAAHFTTQDGPYIQHEALTITSDSINDDGTANPGEWVRFSIALHNVGNQTAPGVEAILSSTDPYLTIHDNAGSFGEMAPGESVTSAADEYLVELRRTCPHDRRVPLALEIRDATGRVWTAALALVVIDNVGPVLHWRAVTPQNATPAEAVTIAGHLEDGSGIHSVEAVLQSPDGSPLATVDLHDDGAHGDGGARDGLWAASWITDADAKDYHVDIIATDGRGNQRIYDNAAMFTTHAFQKTAEVLLVLDNGDDTTWLQSYYRDALTVMGYAHDLWDSRFRGTIDATLLGRYAEGAVVWSSPGCGAIVGNPALARGYLGAGGRLFLSSQDAAWCIDDWGDREFLHDTLHATFVQDSSGVWTLAGTPGDPIGDGLRLTISGGDGANNQLWPDEIEPIPPAVAVVRYQALAQAAPAPPIGLGSTGVGPVAPKGSPEVGERAPAAARSPGAGGLRADTGRSRLVFFSFGIEGIDNRLDRVRAVGRGVTWLLGNQPKAAFVAATTAGQAPLAVELTDLSAGEIVTCTWSFGDGTSADRCGNVEHTYQAAGVYTVTLTASGPKGHDAMVRPGLIAVRPQTAVYLPLCLRGQ